MNCESHFNSALNNAGAAEFVWSLCSAFDCLAWEAVIAKMFSLYGTNSPGVCRAGNVSSMGVEGAV